MELPPEGMQPLYVHQARGHIEWYLQPRILAWPISNGEAFDDNWIAEYVVPAAPATDVCFDVRAHSEVNHTIIVSTSPNTFAIQYLRCAVLHDPVARRPQGGPKPGHDFRSIGDEVRGALSNQAEMAA